MIDDKQKESAPVSPARRRVLKAGAVAGGSLLFGFSLFGCEKKDAGQQGDREQPPPEKAVGQAATNYSGQAPGLAHDAFIRIDRDGLVTLIIHKVEMGQGTSRRCRNCWPRNWAPTCRR